MNRPVSTPFRLYADLAFGKEFCHRVDDSMKVSSLSWNKLSHTEMHNLWARRCIWISINLSSQSVSSFNNHKRVDMKWNGKNKELCNWATRNIFWWKTIFSFVCRALSYQLLELVSTPFLLVTRLVNSIKTDIVSWNIVNIVQRRATNGDIFEIECVSVSYRFKEKCTEKYFCWCFHIWLLLENFPGGNEFFLAWAVWCNKSNQHFLFMNFLSCFRIEFSLKSRLLRKII